MTLSKVSAMSQFCAATYRRVKAQARSAVLLKQINKQLHRVGLKTASVPVLQQPELFTPKHRYEPLQRHAPRYHFGEIEIEMGMGMEIS